MKSLSKTVDIKGFRRDVSYVREPRPMSMKEVERLEQRSLKLLEEVRRILKENKD